MARNRYFAPHDSTADQSVYNRLVTESINIYGKEMYYIPRRIGNYDQVYGSDDASYFDTTYNLMFYIKNIEGFEGDRTFMSKFLMEIRDQITLVCSRSSFETELSVLEPAITRPREGDLIYFPQNKKCFEIKYVDYTVNFYPLGSLPTYAMKCELYEYSNERFVTGIEEIDSIQPKLSINVLDRAIVNEAGLALLDENGSILVRDDYALINVNPEADNDTLKTDVTEFLDLSEINPLVERY